MRRPGTFAMLAAATALAVACSPAGNTDGATSTGADRTEPQAQALPGAAAGVLGTITATLSGTERTWHVVAGPSQGHAYSSGVWMDVEPGRRTIALGAFDTPTPPLDSFEWGENDMPTTYGDYAGSTMLINLTVGASPAPFTLIYPPETTPAVMYATEASTNPLTVTFGIDRGTVDVTSISITNGRASVSGTFSGTLTHLMGSGTVEITGGTFDVSGVPNVSTLR